MRGHGRVVLRLLWIVLTITWFWPLEASCGEPAYPQGEGSESADYRLGPGDTVKISVFGHPDLSTEGQVSQTGNITFPLLGQVKVGGLTVREVEDELAGALATGEFIRQPQVTVLVTQFQSQTIAVLGQVNRPGKYAIHRASRVLDLLAEAGGVDAATAADDATLLRRTGEKVTIDLRALFEGERAQNALVYEGDVIHVPRAPQFYIYGEVQRPGSYRLERNMSVRQAISQAGGLTARGTQWSPTVTRRNAQGEEREIDAESSDLLQPNDVLHIRESWF